MKRQAPKAGYDFGNKRQYRRDIYAKTEYYFKGQLADKKILIMPSSEGDEIAVAMSKGFRQNNIFICDKNPAIVATLKRKFPLINTYGVGLDRAAERITNAGIKIDMLNADLCGPVGVKLNFILKKIADSGMMADDSLVYVTVLKGRELKNHLIKVLGMKFISVDQNNPKTPNDIDGNNAFRVHQIMWATIGLVNKDGEVGKDDIYHAPYYGFIRAWKEYKSSCGQVMLWVGMRLHKMPCACDDCFTAWKLHNINRGMNLGDEERALSLYSTVLWLNYGKEKFNKMMDEKMPSFIDRTKVMKKINEILDELGYNKRTWN